MTGFYSFYDCSDPLCKYTAFPVPMSSLLGTSVAHHVVLASANSFGECGGAGSFQSLELHTS